MVGKKVFGGAAFLGFFDKAKLRWECTAVVYLSVCNHMIRE